MKAGHCAVGTCTESPVEQVIVALRTRVGLASVCRAHGDAIRRGTLETRAFPAGRRAVGLEPLPRR